MSSGRPLEPTFIGHVATTKDALMLFEACLSGTLPHVPRRPHDRERNTLIKSGHVFIYEENASGIKRWTDGVPWSPSRIKGNFLLYRELSKPFPPGEKKRAIKRNKRSTKPGEPYPRPDGGNNACFSPTTPIVPALKSEGSLEGDAEERELTGSLVDSYDFKKSGLFKKTMSVTVNGVYHHLVSYYTVDEVKNGTLMTPQTNPRYPRLMSLVPRLELMQRQNFRSPIDDDPDGMPDQTGGVHPGYVYNPNAFDPRRMGQPVRPPPSMGYYHPFTTGGQIPGSYATTTGYYQPQQPVHRADGYGDYGNGQIIPHHLNGPVSSQIDRSHPQTNQSQNLSHQHPSARNSISKPAPMLSSPYGPTASSSAPPSEQIRAYHNPQANSHYMAMQHPRQDRPDGSSGSYPTEANPSWTGLQTGHGRPTEYIKREPDGYEGEAYHGYHGGPSHAYQGIQQVAYPGQVVGGYHPSS